MLKVKLQNLLSLSVVYKQCIAAGILLDATEGKCNGGNDV